MKRNLLIALLALLTIPCLTMAQESFPLYPDGHVPFAKPNAEKIFSVLHLA
ncbi:MAG: hypothetical protein JKY70_13130, partial [Mucilaginibacter sp.]|nr:hypothetical protein [Mucilaginibacter sp.]